MMTPGGSLWLCARDDATWQDNVPPIPNQLAREIVASHAPELMGSLSSLPVAAASLCSVYKAVVGGKDVAVKVQRPGTNDVLSNARMSYITRALRSYFL